MSVIGKQILCLIPGCIIILIAILIVFIIDGENIQNECLDTQTLSIELCITNGWGRDGYCYNNIPSGCRDLSDHLMTFPEWLNVSVEPWDNDYGRYD